MGRDGVHLREVALSQGIKTTKLKISACFPGEGGKAKPEDAADAVGSHTHSPCHTPAFFCVQVGLGCVWTAVGAAPSTPHFTSSLT